MILNIETSAENCSVSLSEGMHLVDVREDDRGLKSAALLTVFIEELLQKQGLEVRDLDAVGVSRGPGSYTGLRIGVSVAKGLCYGAGVPLISVSTPEALCRGYIDSLPSGGVEGVICPLIDARRMEVYTAVFDGSATLLSPVEAHIVDSGSFAEWLNKVPVHFVGNAVPKCREVLVHPNANFHEEIRHSARYLPAISGEAFRQSRFENVAYFEPCYFKDFMATKPRNKFF